MRDETRDTPPETVVVDEAFDVRTHLDTVRRGYDDYRREDATLERFIREIDLEGRGRANLQRAYQASRRRELAPLLMARRPLELSHAVLADPRGYAAVRQRLTDQFRPLSRAERLLWLHSFLFILTPDLRALNDKVAAVRGFRSLGQRRNFLLGGPSGMGKTTYLDWLVARHLPRVEETRNDVPIIKIDAPENNRSPKPLLQRLIRECGRTYLLRDTEEDLLMQLGVYLNRCGTDLIIVDEVEHITSPEMRRRLLEMSNLTRRVPIICASCHPLRWVSGDDEVAGRWNDHHELRPYTGERLEDLLAFIELLLPFPRESHLSLLRIDAGRVGGDPVDGPARLIERWTGGILRDIMILIADASRRAIEEGLPCVSPSLLQATQRRIQTHPVVNVLEALAGASA